MRKADAFGSRRWDTSTGLSGEVDQVLGTVHWKEWRRILNANRYYRFGTRAPVSNATTGRYLLSDLDSGSADSLEKLYRVIGFTIDNIVYSQVSQDKYLLGEANNSAARVYWREGSNLMALPKELGKVASVFVNHLPQRIDALATDASEVVFPEGYEEILALESAAMLMIKGGAETNEAQSFRNLAEELRQEMLQDITRDSTKPMRFEPDDSSAVWGG